MDTPISSEPASVRAEPRMSKGAAGEVVPMHRRDNLYFIKMWIKPNEEEEQPASFQRQGR